MKLIYIFFIFILFTSIYLTISANNLKIKLICNTCQSMIGKVQKYDFNLQKKFLAFFIKEICTLGKIFPATICNGTVDEMASPLFQSLVKHLLDPDLICPKLGMCDEIYQEINIINLVNDILKDKPKNEEIKPTKRDTLKMLHVSDIHTDLEYKEGSNASCGYPLCCREESPKTENFTPAGKWGSYADCDLPNSTLKQFTSFVKENFKPDLAIWTGDNTSHDIWHQSVNRNLENTKEITKLFQENFKFSLYPVIGNHESFPVNVYDFLSNRENFFDAELSNYWRDWLGNEAVESIKINAFYSTFNEKLNLRILGLNCQACNPENWYLLRDPTDPGNMLEWLRKELYKSEEKKERVYILTHMSPIDCLESWANVYTAIIDRFSYIIRGQFAGHNHGDLYTVFRDSSTNKVNNVLYMASSLTTYSKRNPSFRIYEIDLDTLLPIDYNEYRLNLGKWNNLTNENIEWDLAYTFSKEYKLNDSTYESYEKLTEMLRTDQETVEKYARNVSSQIEELKKKKIKKI
jgi:sphingomyelin phosphodiesterase